VVGYDDDVLAEAAEGGEVGVGLDVAYPPEVSVRAFGRGLLFGDLVAGGLSDPLGRDQLAALPAALV
jgi:hypothetical protein